jgi:hypothetical protein
MALPAYFEQYPDVAVTYSQNNFGLSPEAFAQAHFENYGRNEQRISPQVAEVASAGAAGSGTTITPTYTPVAAAYFNQNPDVAQAYQVETYGLTPDQFAAAHYTQYGGKEQRASPTIVSAVKSGNLSTLPKYFQDNPDVALSYTTNTYGLTPEQFAARHFELYGKKEQRVAPLVAPPVVTTGAITGTPTTPTTMPVGQFRELFPSFAESKRLAGQMVANRPSTQSIINMIQGQTGTPTTPIGTTPITTPVNNALPAYFRQNPDVAAQYANRFNDPNLASTINMTPEQFAATHYQKFGQTEQRAAPVGASTAMPSLNNVLSMISK